MDDKYKTYIERNYPNAACAKNRCKDASLFMKEEFPELLIAKGYYVCPIGGRIEHWWLETDNGEIIDPTYIQFPTIGNYKKLTGDDCPIGKCRHCGGPILPTSYTRDYCTINCWNNRRIMDITGTGSAKEPKGIITYVNEKQH